MNRSLNLILALFVAVQLVVAAQPARAKIPVFKKKAAPTGNVWKSNTLVNEVLNFRFSNGDVVVLRTPQMFGSRSSVQVRRKGEESVGAAAAVELNGVMQLGGPAQLFVDRNPNIIENYKPVEMANAPTKINVVYVRGGNGILVIGQINQVHPAAYFTYLIRGEDRQLPKAQVTYLLPPEEGEIHGLAKHADIGLILGYDQGMPIGYTLRVPLYAPSENLDTPDTSRLAPVAAIPRERSTNDDPYFRIGYEGGVFNIPPDLLASTAASSAEAFNNAKIVGVDKLRANRRREKAMKDALKVNIYGQDAAVDKLVFHYGETLMNGMAKPKVLVLMGPSGVGKTFIGQEFARTLYGDGGKFLEVAGNEYSAHLGSLDYMKLLGSASGVSGGQKGELIEWLEKVNGEGVLLINEGDKMHRDVWLKLMELLDQGKITGQNGKALDASKLTILITTNRGATRMFPSSVANWTQSEIDRRLSSFTPEQLKGYYLMKEGADDEKSLPREVINRIDDFIPFGPFSKEAAIYVAQRRAEELKLDYARNFLVNFKVDDTALKQIALTGWSAADDARQLRKQVSTVFKATLDKAVDDLELQNNQTIELGYDTSDVRYPSYRVTVNGKSARLAISEAPSTNPLKNIELKQKLRELYDNMSGEVIGQDVALRNVVKASISHAMRPKNTRPLVIGLLGVSGNGKTETARALAKARFNGHISILPMGEIANVDDFDKMFGSAAKFQGGTIERGFETALRENPEGGVIVFDELSNMGGGHPKARAALLMKLYNIFEEGKFTSPIDGRVYDLSKYTFVLSGNECETLFANMTSDDMLKATWEENRAPAKVRQLLTEADYPPAFINRVKWTLMKPLLSYEVHSVTEKLWKRESQSFMDENKGLTITIAPNFLDRVSVAYFSPDQGGRAVRDIFEDRIGDLLFESLNESGVDTTDLRGVEVQIDLQDNHLKKPYLRRNSPERKVAFIATVSRNGDVLTRTAIDATELAAEQMLLAKDSALAISYHEMGHAAFEGLTPEMLRALGFKSGAKISDITGLQLQYVTIRGGRAGNLKYYGYARSSPIKGAMLNPDREKTIIQIAELWAGSKAQELAGYPKDAGWSNDLEKIRKLAHAYLTTWGLDRELVGIALDKDGHAIIPMNKQELFDRKLNELLDAGEALAEKVVRLRWEFIGTAALELMKKGEINIDRIREIDARVTAMKAVGKRIRTLRPEPLPLESRPALHPSCESLFK